MAESITVEELADSRTGDDIQTTLRYIVRGSDDGPTLRAVLEAQTAETFDGKKRVRVSIDDMVGPGAWNGSVEYEVRAETATTSFSTSGGSQHITQSLETIERYTDGVHSPADYKGTIGASGSDGGVQGVDITVRTFLFQERHIVPDERMSFEYIGLLFELTGTVNNGSWTSTRLGTFAGGEVLLLGADSARMADGNWELTLNFAASKNESDIEIGGITGISKKGWDYLWVQYMQKEDPTAKRFVTVPEQVNIERVYKFRDWADLLPTVEEEE